MEIPEEIVKKLKELKAKRIFIQFPEGLRLRIQKMVNELEENGFETILSVEKCFGACDVRENEAKLLKCDAILHIGHERFLPKSKIPVVYWEYFIDVDPLPILEKEFEKLRDFEKIGLITSIQFVKLLPKVEEFLKKKGKKVFIHKALQYPGQVLGCDLRAAKAIEKNIDCFLAVSAGEFYAVGLVLQTNKPVLNLDLEKGEIRGLEEFKKKIQKIVIWNKSQLKEADKIGLLVSWKKGQLRLPFELKKRLEAQGKEVYILAMDEVTPEKIEGLELDFLINFACPRIAIDDQAKYPIPILNYNQLNSKEFKY
ncbi:MAG: diphthamide biosynthesis enzyme Dph2 [Candidatus Aenigmatarchaeota archaeon]